MNETFILTNEDSALLLQYGLELQKLSGCSRRSYAFGERIVSEGMPIEFLYIVKSGRAKVCVSAPNGKNAILCFYISNGLMGDVEFFSGTACASTTVLVLEPMECIAIPITVNRKYLTRSSAFNHFAARQLAEKLLQRGNSVMESTLYTAENRLCRYILAASNGIYFRDVMTDVAYSIGVSYRHLYRMMGTLCQDGVLEKNSSGYRISNLEELKRRGIQN